MVICRSKPRKPKFKMPVVNYDQDKDIVEYQVIDTVRSTGEGETDFIIEKKVVEVSRMNRQEFYDKQAKDHSIYGIIDKVLQCSDPTLLHQGNAGIYGDFSKLPLDRADAYNNSLAVEEALNKIDPELYGDDLYKFLKEATPEQIEEFYKNKYAPKEQKEGGNE